MCDEFICSDSGVGLCDDDRKLLESLGSKKSRQSDKPSDQAPEVTDNNNNNNVEETNRNIDKDQGSQLDSYLEIRRLPALTNHSSQLTARPDARGKVLIGEHNSFVL